MTDTPGGELLFVVDPLVIESTADGLVVSSPRLRTRLHVEPRVVELLLAARDGVPADGGGAAAGAVARLARDGFLVPKEDTAAAPGIPWDAWGVTAWSLHSQTRDTPFVGSRSDDREHLAEVLAEIESRPRPSAVRAPRSDRVLLLPRVRTRMDAPYRDVLELRRTHRDFADEPITLDAFSDMLHYCFAPLRFADAGPMGVLQLRAAASGGARHETEAFVFALNVTGVRPGLYHYDPVRHGLEPVAPDAGRADLEHLTYRQGFFQHAAFGVLTAAVAHRMSWKYRHPRAYKLLLQNVGHVAQVFSMTATALGLGAALTGAIRDSEADGLLGLDQPAEFTTFALACGVPLRGPDGMPLSVRTPQEPPPSF